MDIVKEVEKYTIEYYEEKVSSLLFYHSIEHTRLVAQMSTTIAEAEGLDERNKQIVVVAAWFHDIGHAVSLSDHETESCKIATAFLSQKGMDEDFIKEVEKCICSTKMGAKKETLNEKIIGDADNAHTGMVNFMDVSNLLRKEMCNFVERNCSKLEYWKQTLAYIYDIKFLTDYAKEHLEPVRQQNIDRVKKRIKKLSAKAGNASTIQNKNTARGIETMFRLTARNQINLSSIADNKANIMLTINAVIVSVLMSTSAINIRAGQVPNFLVPAIILIVGCLTSLVFAILSVRPKFGNGEYKAEDLQNKNINLLFFGNIFKMPYNEYEAGVKEMMDDYDYLYGNLTKDQYNLGKVLAQKYKLLRYSYNFFMVSFVLAVIVFFALYFSKL